MSKIESIDVRKHSLLAMVYIVSISVVYIFLGIFLLFVGLGILGWLIAIVLILFGIVPKGKTIICPKCSTKKTVKVGLPSYKCKVCQSVYKLNWVNPS